MVRANTLETERLLLHPLSVKHAPDLFSVYHHPEAMRYWDTPPHTSVTETEDNIRRSLHEKACWWAILPREQPQVIGVVGYLGNPGVPGMGYILHPDHWGKGYMTEAGKAALEYGFTTLGLDRVELWINDDNLASRRLAQRLGFTFRGRFRQKYAHHEQSHDKYVYGLHVREWRHTNDNTVPTPDPRTFYRIEPILAVANVQETVEFYRDKLGFTLDFLVGDPPNYGGISRGEWTTEAARIQLSQVSDGASPSHNVALYFFVGANIEGLCAEFRENGVTITQDVTSQPWGLKEFQIKDINGYTLRFGTPG